MNYEFEPAPPKQVDLRFNPQMAAVVEQLYNERIEASIKRYSWSDYYYDNRGIRKFTVIFVEGTQLMLRVSISTLVTIYIHGVNLFPGGQVSLQDKELFDKVIDVLSMAHKYIRSSDLVLHKMVLEYRADFKRWKKSVFNFEVPPDLLFMVPINECEITKYESTITMTYRDTIYGNEVTVTGHNEESRLTDARARAKLYAMREEE